VEEDEEWNALLGELLSILEGDLSDQGTALLTRPGPKLLVTIYNVFFIINILQEISVVDSKLFFRIQIRLWLQFWARVQSWIRIRHVFKKLLTVYLIFT
jgi:hypothetical protein